MNSEEYVPTTTPIISANINPRITSPPNKKITSKTKNVVNEVFMVRLNVLFKAALTISSREPDLYPKYSRILSNTTTVSFNE